MEAPTHSLHASMRIRGLHTFSLLQAVGRRKGLGRKLPPAAGPRIQTVLFFCLCALGL